MLKALPEGSQTPTISTRQVPAKCGPMGMRVIREPLILGFETGGNMAGNTRASALRDASAGLVLST